MKKYIPDCITLLNLLCGTLACVAAMQAEFFNAFLLIIGAAVFDFFDGFAARALGAYSDLGKELDSLCDLVSFGLAPSMMTFTWYTRVCGSRPVAYLALLPVLFAALRLAKFNTDTRQSTNFIGLPVPGMAMVTAPLIAFGQVSSQSNCGCKPYVYQMVSTHWFIPVLAIVMSFLLISEIPMFSMKHKKLSFKEFPQGMIFICCFAAILVFYTLYGILSPLGADWLHGAFPLTISTSFTVYILINLLSFKRKNA